MKQKQSKKCKTCVGFGLWAIGDRSPMGKRDSYSLPSIKCPECGSVGRCEVKENND